MSKLIILAGVSGVGKDTLVNKLVKQGVFVKTIPYTSRPMRQGEVEGDDYHFVTKTMFRYLLGEDVFLEHRVYDTLYNGVKDKWYYGTHKSVFNNTKNSVVSLSIDAMEELVNKYPDKCVGILVTCPDSLREARAKCRANYCETEWKRRLVDDETKYNLEELSKKYKTVINIDIDEVLEDITTIIKEII